MSERDPNRLQGRHDPAADREPNHRREDTPDMVAGETRHEDPAELGGRMGEVTGGWRILRNTLVPVVAALVVIYVIYLLVM